MPEPLEAIIARVLEIDPLELSDSRFDGFASWDSQRQIELAFALERAYEVTLDDADIETLDSIASVRAALLKHGRATA